MRAKGGGPAHTDAKLRLFDAASEDDVRVTLYRDDAAWCPGWVDVLSPPHTLERPAIIDSDGPRVPYKDLLVRATAVAAQLRRGNAGEALDEQRGGRVFAHEVARQHASRRAVGERAGPARQWISQ